MELLQQLEQLVDDACRQHGDLDASLAKLDAIFDALTARLPIAPPIAEIVALRQRLTDTEDARPVEERVRMTKFVRGAKRERSWGEVHDQFVERLDQLRYDHGASHNPHACDCLVLVEMGSISRKPRSTCLRGIGWDHDGYYNGDAFACDECGTRWLNCTEDTESQHIEWWEPRDPAWEPARP